ncbi:glycosyltransferase 87 family protein [candidate division KSB1 bacterium]|nr:glycosyltransferase 87 family protein [candidate division KSB1 bacterium]
MSVFNVTQTARLGRAFIEATNFRHAAVRVSGLLIFASFTAIILWKGVLPSLQNARGDFANYYTASRLVANGQPLERAYRDFVWFQKQIDRYGISHQLGGFIPHPPPTALVMLPLAPFEPLVAKRLWIGLNLVLAIAVVLLMAKITTLHWLPVAIIFLSTGFGLINNFLFGQMYLLLLATIVGGLYLQQRGYPLLAGIALGSMTPMKYVGAFFLIYFAWKKEWRLVIAAVFTSLAVIAISWWLQGAEVWRAFIFEVLPRHLQGEIQDPFAIQFQSWNSLLRRMFILDPSRNPQSPLSSPALFVIFKNLIPWLWLTGFVWIYRQTAFSERSHQRLFEIALVPLAILLISPGSATYHFLLLSFSVACFVKILLDLQRQRDAVILGSLYLLINLPHYLKLIKFAAGWLTPIGYARLWLLIFFFVVIGYFFHRAANWRWHAKTIGRHSLAAILIAAITIAANFHRTAAKERDAAEWLPLHEKEFDRHLGLLVKTPDLGRERIVFCYGELLDEDYAIFSMTRDGKIEGQWTPDTPQKFYDPDLAADDQRVLMESIQNGRSEIWLSCSKNQTPEFLLEGENPSWHADGERFAFIQDGKIGLASLAMNGVSEPVWLPNIEYGYDLAFSPIDNRLLFCEEEKSSSYMLVVIEVMTGEKKILLESEEPFERPTWSSDAGTIVFSWNRNGNRDLWAMDFATRQLQRLTRDPAIDTAPTWDEANRRIIFASDRGSGLECSTLFWMALPEAKNKNEN